ncbi:hypothetical protein C4K39_5203 [Pseudomonas sessilinigenes]|nr:hypothetical protein C4K39_5203 [Pseudomonas sessilinigenes]
MPSLQRNGNDYRCSGCHCHKTGGAFCIHPDIGNGGRCAPVRSLRQRLHEAL